MGACEWFKDASDAVLLRDAHKLLYRGRGAKGRAPVESGAVQCECANSKTPHHCPQTANVVAVRMRQKDEVDSVGFKEPLERIHDSIAIGLKPAVDDDVRYLCI